MSHTITIPNSREIGATMRRIATTLAVGLAWAIVASEATYRAGLATGRAIHRLNDWMAAAIHDPAAAAESVASALLAWADRILTEPAPAPLLTMLGAEVLTDEQLDAEIAAYEGASLADAFAANCAEMAASDARLYRAAGERIANIRAMPDEAETAPAKPKRTVRRKPATARKAKAEA
jgi:hypothetical protein